MNQTYDAIIVGARCAGSPLAMLLARQGYRVLLVDRANFPSDTVSTHVVQPLAAAALERWGLLDELAATGCPPIHTYITDFGPFALRGKPGTRANPVAYCPRRTILDKLLLDAAARAGAEIREGFTVEQLLMEDGAVIGIRGHEKGKPSVSERSRVVIGADGRHSLVAEHVRPAEYNTKPPLMAAYYSYWSGLPMGGQFETYIREQRGCAAVETHDGLTLVMVGWPYAQFEANKKDLEAHYMRTLELAPAFAERVRGARRETRFAGATLPNFMRKPFGAGWALVGDAGYNKDPITAQGIKDAFLDAERCARALHEAWSGARSYDDALGEYQRVRDEQALPMYEYTCQLAQLEAPPPEMQQLFFAMHGNSAAMDGFTQVNAGTLSPAEFFSPQNIGEILGATRVAS